MKEVNATEMLRNSIKTHVTMGLKKLQAKRLAEALDQAACSYLMGKS